MKKWKIKRAQNMIKSQEKLAFFLIILLFSTKLFAGIKVGVVLPKSGALEIFGLDAERGIEFARKRVTATAHMDFIIEDDKSINIETTNKIHKLINQDICQVIIGEIDQYKSSLISPILESKNILQIALGPNNKLNEEHFLGLSLTDQYQGEVLAKFALNELKKKSTLILFDSSLDYSKKLAKAYKNEFLNGGGKITFGDEYSYNPKDGNYKNIISKIVALKPEVIFIPGLYEDIPQLVNEIRETGLRSIILGGDGWDSPKLMDKLVDKLNRSFFLTNTSLLEKNEKTLKFVREFEMTYKVKPGPFAYIAFDAVSIISEAIKISKAYDSETLKQSLSQLKNYQGVSGLYQFNKNLQMRKTAYILEIEGNRTKLKSVIHPETF